MEYALIAHGELISKDTIHLDEPLPLGCGKVKLMIEPEIPKVKGRRLFGSMKGEIVMRDDFNDPIEDFREYAK